jgi:hypothetical protein
MVPSPDLSACPKALAKIHSTLSSFSGKFRCRAQQTPSFRGGVWAGVEALYETGPEAIRDFAFDPGKR